MLSSQNDRRLWGEIRLVMLIFTCKCMYDFVCNICKLVSRAVIYSTIWCASVLCDISAYIRLCGSSSGRSVTRWYDVMHPSGGLMNDWKEIKELRISFCLKALEIFIFAQQLLPSQRWNAWFHLWSAAGWDTVSDEHEEKCFLLIYAFTVILKI